MRHNFNNPIYTGPETIPLEELSRSLLESSDEENVTHFFEHVTLRLQQSSNSEDTGHGVSEHIEMVPVSGGNNRADQSHVRAVPNTYQTFQPYEHPPSERPWRCPIVGETACVQALIHGMRSLTGYQVHPLAKTGCKVLLGMTAFTLIMALILYFASWNQIPSADTTTTPLLIRNRGTTRWMTLFSNNTVQVTTPATQSSSYSDNFTTYLLEATP